MNIEHLRLFVRIAVTQNISLAGKELGLSAAVASSYISKLEEGLGVRLVHRTTRRVSLTEEGMGFLPHAETVIASVDTARAAIGIGSVSPQGKLRISAPASFGRMHIIPAMAGFIERYPSLQVDLRLSDTIVDMVEGGFDIAIRNSNLSDSTLVARKLAMDTRILCASPSYLADNPEPKIPNDLANHQFINLVGIDEAVFASTDGPISIKMKSQLRCDNGEAVRDACVTGMGLSICSLWCAYEKLRSGELVQVLTNNALINDVGVYAIYPSSHLLAPKVRLFIDYLLDYFGAHPYWEQ